MPKLENYHLKNRECHIFICGEKAALAIVTQTFSSTPVLMHTVERLTHNGGEGMMMDGDAARIVERTNETS